MTTNLPRMINAIPPLKLYRNSTKVMTIKGQPILVEDVIRAALISRSNILFFGGTGWGKTTAENDVIGGLFGGKGIYIEAHPKMDVREIFSHLNLGKYFRGELKSSKELREVLDEIHNNILIVDEITRAPPFTQNRIFGMANGYVILDDNVPHPIGNGYSVLFGSGNIGESFKGTFELDEAFVNRFPIILNLDDVLPSPADMFQSLMRKHDPRVPEIPEKERLDYTPKLKEIYSQVKNLAPSVMVGITAEYLVYGLGDCSKIGRNKLSVWAGLPNSCQGCSRLAEACGYIKGVSWRAAEAIVSITNALQQVALAKHQAAKDLADKGQANKPSDLVNNDVNDVLEVFKTFHGFTGIVNARYVMQKYSMNPHHFLSDVAAKASQEFDGKMDDILTLLKAIDSRVPISEDMLKPFTKELSAGVGSSLRNPWRFVRDLVGV